MQTLFNWTVRNESECKHYDNRITIDLRHSESQCYYLNVPHKDLINLPGAAVFSELFIEYKSLVEQEGSRTRPVDGTLYAQLNNAKEELKKASVRAENRFGPINITRTNMIGQTVASYSEVDAKQKEVDGVLRSMNLRSYRSEAPRRLDEYTKAAIDSTLQNHPQMIKLL